MKDNLLKILFTSRVERLNEFYDKENLFKAHRDAFEYGVVITNVRHELGYIDNFKQKKIQMYKAAAQYLENLYEDTIKANKRNPDNEEYFEYQSPTKEKLLEDAIEVYAEDFKMRLQ